MQTHYLPFFHLVFPVYGATCRITWHSYCISSSCLTLCPAEFCPRTKEGQVTLKKLPDLDESTDWRIHCDVSEVTHTTWTYDVPKKQTNKQKTRQIQNVTCFFKYYIRQHPPHLGIFDIHVRLQKPQQI